MHARDCGSTLTDKINEIKFNFLSSSEVLRISYFSIIYAGKEDTEQTTQMHRLI